AASTYAAVRAARQSQVLNEAYQRARGAIAEEEALESQYRLEPGRALIDQGIAAAAAFDAALGEVSRHQDQRETALATELLAAHARYRSAVDRLIAAVAAGDGAGARAIDEAEADPAFARIAARVEEAAGAHIADADRRLAEVERSSWVIATATP